MKVMSVNCPNCGSSVNLDMENPQQFCSRCGSKLLLDIETIQELMIEKEKTKQIEIRTDANIQEANARRRHQSKMLIVRLIVTVCWVIVGFISVLLIVLFVRNIAARVMVYFLGGFMWLFILIMLLVLMR